MFEPIERMRWSFECISALGPSFVIFVWRIFDDVGRVGVGLPGLEFDSRSLVLPSTVARPKIAVCVMFHRDSC